MSSHWRALSSRSIRKLEPVALLVKSLSNPECCRQYSAGRNSVSGGHLLSSSGGMAWTDSLRPEQKLAYHVENAKHQEQLPSAYALTWQVH